MCHPPYPPNFIGNEKIGCAPEENLRRAPLYKGMIFLYSIFEVQGENFHRRKQQCPFEEICT